MHNWAQDLPALIQVLVIDLVLAGDNAVVVGLVVANLSPENRKTAVVLGIGGAAVIRLLLAAVTLQLLQIIGLTFAGGILLLWVCWKTYRELLQSRGHGKVSASPSLLQAMLRIVLADLSMSLDNVLAVAGASIGRPWIMAAGLIISVLLMGTAAALIAQVLDRHRILGWGGLLLILFVALKLIWQGSHQIIAAIF